MLAVVHANFMDGDDILVLETGGRRRFGAKAFHKLRTGERAEGKHLQCDDPVRAHLSRLINYTHAASADFFEQVVISETSQRWNFRLRLSAPWCAIRGISVVVDDVEIRFGFDSGVEEAIEAEVVGNERSDVGPAFAAGSLGGHKLL